MGRFGGPTTRYWARLVAVKLLRSEYVSDATFRDRFRTEAGNTAALSHPGIVQVHDFGEARIVSSCHRRRCRTSLWSWCLANRYPRSSPERARWESQESGVVHRDVKPANFGLDARIRERTQFPVALPGCARSSLPALVSDGSTLRQCSPCIDVAARSRPASGSPRLNGCKMNRWRRASADLGWPVR
jgi:hypothetical protein